jgi:hypothetical protein
MAAIPDVMMRLGPAETQLCIENGIEKTTLARQSFIIQETQKAARFHKWGLVLSITGAILVFVGGALVLLGRTELDVLPLVVGAISEAIGILFFRQENQILLKVHSFYDRMDYLFEIETLYKICNELQDPSQKDAIKLQILTLVLGYRYRMNGEANK